MSAAHTEEDERFIINPETSVRLQQKSIDIPNGPVQYFTCGRGKPMLLLHGFLGRPQDFRWILPTVSQHYEAFLPEPGMVSTPLGDHPALDQRMANLLSNS